MAIELQTTSLETIKLSELPEAIALNESDYSLIVQNGTSKKIKGLLLKGNTGDNGKSIEIRKTDTHIQWRQEEGQWINLVALADLKGDKGEQGGGSNVDLTDYATKVWVTQQLASYYTKVEIDLSLSNKADISHTHTEYASIDHVHNYNDLTNKPTIPSKTSDLANDSGFLISIPSEYVTEEEMSTALSTKANKSDIPSLDGYATENFVTTKIAEAALNGSGVDLSGYATKDDLTSKVDKVEGKSLSANDLTNELKSNYDKAYLHSQSTHVQSSDIPNKVSDLQNDSGFITAIPDEYVTETELEAKGYLTSHQDISGLQTKTDNTLNTIDKTVVGAINELKDGLDNVGTGGGGSVDLTNYASDLSLKGNLLQLKNSNGNIIGNPVTLPSISSSTSKLCNNEIITTNSDSNVQFLYDVEGNPINCHGMGILYHNGIYYAYGESKTGETTQSGGNYYINTTGVNCYSSIDLVNWKFENKVLKPNLIDETSLLYKTKIVERPKVIYNEKNDNFVMVWHSDVIGYGFAKIGFAVCDTPTGDFTILDAKRPTTVNTTCRDLTLFKDDDGSAYIFVSQDNNDNMYCHKLNDDYTDFTSAYSCVIPNNQKREAPAVFKHNSKYYIVTSGCTGWNPNPTKIYSCNTIMGTYTLENTVCKNDTSNNSYGSQPTFVIDVKGKNMNCDYILCFDQWVPTNLETSTYLWLPLFIDEADNKFYVDNTSKNRILYNNDLVYKQLIISDTSSIFYGKTINSCLIELYNMIMGILNQKVESVSIDPKSYSLEIGKTKILAAELLPTNGVYKKITWSSNNEHVSITPNGKLCTIEGVSEGSSTITVTVDDLTATSTITVLSGSGGSEVVPDGLVFKINTNSLNGGKLTDLSSGLVATLNGSPSISGNAIDFTGSTFLFDISSLNLKDFTLKIKYTPTAANTGNIITLGNGTWANSFTLYQKDKILFNCGARAINNVTVGVSDGAATTGIGEIINLNELNEIVFSYESSTRNIYVWLNGSLIQDGSLGTFNISLTKLCNTEGNARYSGSYSLIEIFNKAYNSYSLIP